MAGLFLTLLLVLARPPLARATILERMSIEEMAQRATMVVEGTVGSITVEETSEGVRTAVRLREKDSLKGVLSTFKTIYVAGGTLPDDSQIVGAMASFRPGDTCYVFVDVRGWVMGGFHGKVDVVAVHVLGSGASTAATNRRLTSALHPGKLSASRPTRPATPRPANPVAPALAGQPVQEQMKLPPVPVHALGEDPWPPRYIGSAVTDAGIGLRLRDVLIQVTNRAPALSIRPRPTPSVRVA